jgi:hypothetical protein
MTPSALLELARDTTLIKGIYEACDLWCMYCHATDRCLLFRCSSDGRRSGDIPTDRHDFSVDGLRILKNLAEAEGRSAPIEIDAFLSNDRRKKTYLFSLDDPLERMGGSYMHLSNAYLRSRRDFPFDVSPRPSGPTPLEVFAWFHDLVPARIFRAVLSAGAARAGLDDRTEDALGAAKLALVGIDRSLDALTAMAADDDDPRLTLMQAHLHRLTREVEERFPDARCFTRPGLDAEHHCA